MATYYKFQIWLVHTKVIRDSHTILHANWMPYEVDFVSFRAQYFFLGDMEATTRCLIPSSTPPLHFPPSQHLLTTTSSPPLHLFVISFPPPHYLLSTTSTISTISTVIPSSDEMVEVVSPSTSATTLTTPYSAPSTAHS